ncbi:MAG: phosphodiester glycosidase family protein [Clostridiales bacterium]|nr:phosphodiester glycosidase family protein [Clostridiales bacterium]
MKLYVRILLAILCAAMVLAMPFALSSPRMLDEPQWMILDQLEGDESGLLSFLLPAARAEADDNVIVEAEYALPIDFTPGYKPNPDGYTDWGYEDDSIRVQMETREENGVIWRIAWVEVASPTQLRTAIAGKKITSKTTARVAAMAEKNNAIVALSGDNFVDNPSATSYEYRMGQKLRNKSNKLRDILIIDEKGDFHTFIRSKGVDDFEGTIVNAFTFGPALVQKGELLTTDKEYKYNPNGKEPRAAIGQLGTLSYVMVIAEGRGESTGVTHQGLADFMYSLGCIEAYNLDGGGSAAMVYQGEYFNDLSSSERSLSDIIYFATAVPDGGN